MFTKLKNELDSRLGLGWERQGLEPETVMLELNRSLTPIERDQVSVLYILGKMPTLFYEDLVFTLYATEVINGNQADFAYLPEPTSLELAWAITAVGEYLGVTGGEAPDVQVKELVKKVLTNEGYSVALPPFDRFITTEDLTPGQLPEDTRNKSLAISAYITLKKKET